MTRTRHSRTKKEERDASALLSARRSPTFSGIFLSEPTLEFGEHRLLVDPRVGLGIFGPVDRTLPRRAPVRLGLIATGVLTDKVRQWIARCQTEVEPLRRVNHQGNIITKRTDPDVVPSFPGCKSVFDTDFMLVDGLIETITDRDLAELRQIKLYEPRVTKLAEILGKRLGVIADKASPPDVVIVALPTELRRLCTVPSNHQRRGKRPFTLADLLRQERARDEAVGQMRLFDGTEETPPEEEETPEHVVLHSALKIQGMRAGLPTQLIWEKTLDGIGVEDDATCAWNIWSGLYYKAHNELWRLTGLTANSCFVGISFFKDRHDENLRCCVAQAFSDRGEGLVLRSEPFRWDNEFERTPHLTKSMANQMLTQTLTAYMEHMKTQPSRVVIHKWQRFWPDEREGFEEAINVCGANSFDFVAFGSRGIRFYRAGKEAPIRGTYIALGDTEGLLFTRGYVPFLRRYPGMRVPRPLEIVEHHGSGSMTQIAQEILALTKLDWNTTMFAGKEPITTAFAQDVGHILAELPKDLEPKRSYRFYM